MIVRRLSLTNFRRFKQLDLTDLPLGLTGILGKNGSGKSTILEAIGWALYGTYALASKTGKDGVRMQAVAPDESCEVTLEFEIGDDSYKVVRRLKGKAATAHAFVYKNGGEDAVAEREDGVNKFIAKLFGMDRATFFASVFAQQKELDMLTAQTPAERRRIIRRLLRINLIDDAITEIRSDCRLRKDAAENIRSMILDVTVVKAEIEKLSGEQKKKASEKKEQEKRAEELTAVLKDAKASKHELDAKRKAHQQVEKILAKIEKDLQNNENSKKKYEVELSKLEIEKKELVKIAPKEKDYVAATEALEELEKMSRLFEEKKTTEKDLAERRDDLARVLKAKGDLNAKLASYKDLAVRKNKAEAELKASRGELQKIAKETEAINTKVQICREAMAKIKEDRKQASKLGPKSKCPTCFRDLGDSFEKILEHFDTEETKNSKAIKEHTARLGELEGAELKAEERNSKAEEILEEIRSEEKDEAAFRREFEKNEVDQKNITGGIARREKRLKEIGELDFSVAKYEAAKKKKKELAEVHERIKELETETRRIPELEKEIKALGEKLAELGREKKASDKQIEGIGFSEKDLAAADKTFEVSQRAVHEQDKKIAETEHAIKLLGVQMDQKNEALEQQKELQKKLEAAQSESKRLEVLGDVMDKFRQDLAGRIQPMLIARTSQLVSQTTGGKYVAVDLDDEYNIYVYDGTERFLIKRFSGGEQDLVSLCLRIAISQVISEQNGGAGVNFIALDEIFGSQDAGRKESILTALNALSGQFQQIFLITHHEDLKDSMQHVLSVEEVEDGVSEAAFVV